MLDKEEKEMDEAEEDDDEDGETIEKDVDLMEEAIEEAVKQVSKMAKPVRQVLFKVGLLFFSLLFFFFRSNTYDLSPAFLFLFLIPLLSLSSFFKYPFTNTALPEIVLPLSFIYLPLHLVAYYLFNNCLLFFP